MADLLSKENEIYQSPVKVAFLLILEIGSAFLMSFYFRQFAADFGSQKLILFLVGLILFLTFSFFSALFIRGFLWSGLAVGLSLVAGLAVFYDYFSPVLIVFGFFIFWVFFWGIGGLRFESENSLKIKISRLLKIFLAKASLGTAILISLFCYFLFSAGSDFPISFENLQFLLKPNEKLLAIFIPEFSFQKPLQTVLAGVLEQQLAPKIPNFEKLPASAKSIIIEEAVRQEFLAGLEQFLGIRINPRDSVDRVIYDSLKIKFNQLGETVKKWIIIGVFVALFFAIRFLFIPLNWLLSAVIFLIYLVLLALNFASIRLESRSKEVLII